jgi:hypothetical protein
MILMVASHVSALASIHEQRARIAKHQVAMRLTLSCAKNTLWTQREIRLSPHAKESAPPVLSGQHSRGGEGDVLRRGLTQRWPQREDHERSRQVTDTGKGLKVVKRVGRFRPNSIPTALVGLVMLPTSDEVGCCIRASQGDRGWVEYGDQRWVAGRGRRFWPHCHHPCFR